MRATYNRLLDTADDDTIDAFVDRELRRRPVGRLEIVQRLNWIRRELTFPEVCIDSPRLIRKEIARAIVALRRRSPNAAHRLRALGNLLAFDDLAVALATIADVGPVG